MDSEMVRTLATQKLKDSIGFHDIAFDDMFKTVFDKGEEVRRSNNITERSVAQEARMEVSV